MIINKDANRSLVIPKWLPFFKVCNDRDYNFPRKKDFIINPKTEASIRRDYSDFKNNPTVLSASDLLSSAIAINHMEIARDVARYLKSRKDVNDITIHLAERILDENSRCTPEPGFIVQISTLRQFLSKYPKNPIYWIELARLYTVKGYIKKANRAVISALSLAPFDRYIVRCGFRFFIHIDECEKAFYYVNKAVNFTSDPWLRATQLNAAILNESKLGRIRKPNPKAIPSGQIFHYSEYIESIGILELLAGNDKKAKKNFKLAWSDPSENVIAHGDWVLRNRFPSLADSSGLDFSKSLEASAWQNYYRLKLATALDYARDWCLQEPYSTHPFLCGSEIACQARKSDESIRFSKEGLKGNPNNLSLKNNLAYAYLLSNNQTEAENILSTYPKTLSEDEKIYYLATKGLLNYKKGNISLGRSLYLESISLSEKTHNPKLAASALLHLAIAELESRGDMATYYSKRALDVSKHFDIPYILLPRRHLLELLTVTA